MGWEYHIGFDDTAFQGVFGLLAKRATDLTPAMDEIGAMLMLSTDLHFEQGIDPDGKPWTPLAPATVKEKARLGQERILQRSRRLRSSVTRKPDSSSVTVGTNLAYAAAHQGGAEITHHAQSRQILRQFVTTKSGRNELLPGFAKRTKANFATWHQVPEHIIKIPARPFLGINEADKNAAMQILTKFLTRGLR